MDQRKWIRSIKKGEKKYLYDIAETYYADVYRFCAFHTGNREDAYDLTQETFLRFIQYSDNYREKNLKSYLLAIAMNLCRTHYRNSMACKEAIPPDELSEESYVSKEPSPEQHALHKDSVSMLLQVLKTLPEIQREAIMLHYFHDLKYREISRITGCSISTVKSRIRQGTEKLRRTLKKEDFFNET